MTLFLQLSLFLNTKIRHKPHIRNTLRSPYSRFRQVLLPWKSPHFLSGIPKIAKPP